MPKFTKINSWDEFSPLKTVLLGSVFDPTFFSTIKNSTIEYTFKKIFDETIEDLNYFKTTLESHGINVYQSTPTELGYKESIMDYIDHDGRLGWLGPTQEHDITRNNLIPAPPLQVRDETIIMGNEVFVTENAFTVHMLRPKYIEWFGEENCNFDVLDGKIRLHRSDHALDSLLKRRLVDGVTETDVTKLSLKEKLEIKEKKPVPGFCAPNITRIGKNCLVDIWQTSDIKSTLKSYYPMFEYKEIDLFGHDDSVFSVLKPGLVIAADWVREYDIKSIFPNWEITYFDDPNWSQVEGWRKLKYLNKGKWWVPGEEENNEFTQFVEEWLDNWTGEVEETIFDVNCLVLDDKYVVTNSENPVLVEALHKHNMEPVFCPLRHRFFFDGGWHCLTLDIEREGGQNDYKL